MQKKHTHLLLLKGLFLLKLTDEERAIEEISKAIDEKPKASVDEIQKATGIPMKQLRKLLKKGEDIGWTHKAVEHNKHQYVLLEKK